MKKITKISAFLLAFIFMTQLFGITALAATEAEMTYTAFSEDFSSDLSKWTINSTDSTSTYIKSEISDEKLVISSGEEEPSDAVTLTVVPAVELTDDAVLEFDSKVVTDENGVAVDYVKVAIGSGYILEFDTLEGDEYASILYNDTSVATTSTDTTVKADGKIKVVVSDNVITVSIDDTEILSYTSADVDVVPAFGFTAESKYGVNSSWQIDNVTVKTVEPITNEEIVAAVEEAATKTVIDENFDGEDATTEAFTITYNWPSTGSIAVADGRLGIVNASATAYNERKVFSVAKGTAGLATYISFDFQGADYSVSRADETNMYFGESVYVKYTSAGYTFSGFGKTQTLDSASGIKSISATNNFKAYVYGEYFLLYINDTLAVKIKDASVASFAARPGARIYSGQYGCIAGTFAFLDNVKLLREKTEAELNDEATQSIKEASTVKVLDENFEGADITVSDIITKTKDTNSVGSFNAADGKLKLAISEEKQYTTVAGETVKKGAAGVKNYISYELKSETYANSRIDYTYAYFGSNVYVKFEDYGSKCFFKGFGETITIDKTAVGFSIANSTKYEAFVDGDCFMLYINGVFAAKVQNEQVKAFVPYIGIEVYGSSKIITGTDIALDNLKIYREKTADEKLLEAANTAEAECTKTVLNEDFSLNDVTVNFEKSSFDVNFYSLEKTNEALDLFVGKNGTSAGYAAAANVLYKGEVSGKTVSEFTVNFAGGYPEYGYVLLGKTAGKYLSIAFDNYTKEFALYSGTLSSAAPSASDKLKVLDKTVLGIAENTDIKIKTVAFDSGVLVYVNNIIAGSYECTDFAAKPGIRSYANYTHSRHVYMDNFVIKTVPDFEDLATWNIVSENFDSFKASETTSEVTSNTRLILTEQSNCDSYTQAVVDDLSVLKMVLAEDGALSYQTHAGFRVNSNLRDNYVIETKLRADVDSLPQGLIINLGKKDGTTNQTIGFAMSNYRSFYGMTAYGTNVYYNPQKYVSSVCGEDVGFKQTQWHTYKFVVNGNTVKVYIDGILKLTYENESMTTNGNIGIRFTSANQANPTVYVDSFTVKSTAPEATKLHCTKTDTDTETGVNVKYEIAKDFAYENGTVFMAVYEDGKLVNIKMENMTFDPNTLSETFSIGQKKTEGKNYEVKVFTWDNGLKPIFDVK